MGFKKVKGSVVIHDEWETMATKIERVKVIFENYQWSHMISQYKLHENSNELFEHGINSSFNLLYC